MRPSKRLIKLLVIFVVSALGLALLRLYYSESTFFSSVWWFALAAFSLIAFWDGFLAGYKNPLTVYRNLPGSFAVGVGNKVTIRLDNNLARDLNCIVTDHYPKQIHVKGLPISVNVAANKATEFKYWAHPNTRGDAIFTIVDVRIKSPMGLWDYRYCYDIPQTVSVYPNFTAITQFEQLGHDQQSSQLGVHLLQRRGEGLDFHQLREYRDGDTSRQVDWKASSRRRKLIAREYQDERDQDIIFLLDCGRRMHAKDGDLSHFDHCLNSMLLLSYVALRQGDGIGLLSYAGDKRWLPPVKGKAKINTILNTVYDLHSSTRTSDLVEAATELMARHRKRALVIVLTNIREEDRDDVVAATQLLNKKHLVMVASLRENFLDEVIEESVSDFDSSLLYCETTEILAMRKRLLDRVRSSGVIVADSIPQQLPIQLVNQYWALKRSGRI